MPLTPWKAEIPLSEEIIARILAEQFPDRSFGNIQKFGEGWDNEIYLLDSQLLFRIAKREMGIDLARTEIEFLPQIQKFISFPIPIIQFSGLYQNKYPFFAYPLMPGEIASSLSLSQEAKGNLVKPIATFLNELRSIPVSHPTSQQLPRDITGRTNVRKRLAQIKEQKEASKQFSIEFDWEILQLLEENLCPESTTLTQLVVHGDFHIRNFLVNEQSELAGIIDWGDMHFGNPAKDLTLPLFFFNKAQLAEFMEIYPFRENQLFELTTMCAINLILHLIPYAHGIADEKLLAESILGLKHIEENFWAFTELGK